MSNPKTTKAFILTLGGGQRPNRRGTYYPDFIKLRVAREDALTLASALVGAIQHAERTPEAVIELPLFGELLRSPEEEPSCG